MKVLIVDDEPHIVHLIRMNLKLEGYETVCAESGAAALEAYRRERPDIVLLDIMLPDMEGYDVLRQIQEMDHSAAVIFLTANDKRTSKILGLGLGADDYITKPFDNRELVLRVRSLWRRISLARGGSGDLRDQGAGPDQGRSRCGILTLDAASRQVWVGEDQVTLTFREFDLLHYLIRNRRRVLGREELLENIWGYSYLGSSRSVDLLVQRLRQKLGPAGEYIRTLYGVGYRFEVEE